jgi:tetratricopeptide (TPR) repeat protein
MEYAEENWCWITTEGPERLESNSNGTLEANLTIPKGTSLSRLDGYIKISSNSHTFEIPVTWSSNSGNVGQYQIESQVRDGNHADTGRYDDRMASSLIISESKPVSSLRPNPYEAETWKNKGNVLSRQGNLDEAIKAYDKALVPDPKYASAWNAKGVSLAHLGKYDEAIQILDRAIELKPEYCDAWNNKGYALTHMGKYDEAIQILDKAIELDQTNAVPFENKGFALSKLGRTEEANAAYAKAKELGYRSGLGYGSVLGT